MTGVIQAVTLVLSAATILLYAYRAIKRRSYLLISIPAIVLMAHFCVFFLVKGSIENHLDINTWSSAIRLQTTLTFFSYAIYNIYRDRLTWMI